jgi:hypothetical protein
MSENRVVTATYREIAYRFGIGIEGARIKTKRRAAKGLWRIIPGNHPQDIIRVENGTRPNVLWPTLPTMRPQHPHPNKRQSVGMPTT